jgi:cellulase/cellobiase CelA1
VANQWGGNFQGEVTVKNTGTSASAGWTVTWGFANGQQISQAWSAMVTQSGSAVTARHMSWNGVLAPGASTMFGFIASWNNATNAAPTPSCTLG